MALRIFGLMVFALPITGCASMTDGGPGIAVSKAIMRNSDAAGEDVAAYAAFDNRGSANSVISAQCQCADRVELHQVIRKDGKVSMETVWPFALPAQTKSQIVPGSAFHLMLVNLNRPLKVDEKVEVIFIFDDGPSLKVPFLIVADSAKAWAELP